MSAVVAIGVGMIELDDSMTAEQFRHWRRLVRAELREHYIKLVPCGYGAYRLSRAPKKKLRGTEYGQAIYTKPMTFKDACRAAIEYIKPSNPEK